MLAGINLVETSDESVETRDESIETGEKHSNHVVMCTHILLFYIDIYTYPCPNHDDALGNLCL